MNVHTHMYVFAYMHTHASPHMYAHYACMCIKCMYTHMYVCADVFKHAMHNNYFITSVSRHLKSTTYMAISKPLKQ